MHAELIEHILLGAEHLLRRALYVVDALQGSLIVGGGDVGIDEILFHLLGVTRVGVGVDKSLKHVNRLVERCATAFVLAHCVVVECRFGHFAVKVELHGFFKRHRGAVELMKLHIAVAHILISALRELVVFGGSFREVCYGFIVVAVAILHHAIGIGSRADGFALACIDVGLEIFFGLLVIAGLVGTFANESVEFVLKCRVIAVGEQRFCKSRGLFEIALGEIYLADVVLRIIAEFAGAVHAIEFLQSSIVAFGGIVEISLIESVGIAVALGALQHAYVHASLLIFAEAKQRVGAAVIYVLLSVGVKSLDAHLVVVTHGFAVFSGKEQMVAYGSPCQVDIRRRWV